MSLRLNKSFRRALPLIQQTLRTASWRIFSISLRVKSVISENIRIQDKFHLHNVAELAFCDLQGLCIAHLCDCSRQLFADPPTVFAE